MESSKYFRVLWSLIVPVWRLARQASVFGVGVSILITVGSAMIYGDDFAAGVCVFVFAALWAAAVWLDSETLRKKKPLRPRPRKNDYDKYLGKFKRDLIKYRFWQWGGVVSICLVLAATVSFVESKREERELGTLSGFLLPANDPTPAIPCLRTEPPPGSLKLFLGHIAVVATKFPHTVITVDGSRELVLNRNQDGSIGITATIVGRDGRIVAEIRDNKFVVNQNNYLDIQRQDHSSLVVRDQYDNTVLDARYMNATSFRIRKFVMYSSTGDMIEAGDFGQQASATFCFPDKEDPSKGDMDFAREKAATANSSPPPSPQLPVKRADFSFHVDEVFFAPDDGLLVKVRITNIGEDSAVALVHSADITLSSEPWTVTEQNEKLRFLHHALSLMKGNQTYKIKPGDRPWWYQRLRTVTAADFSDILAGRRRANLGLVIKYHDAIGERRNELCTVFSGDLRVAQDCPGHNN